jgi:acyl transferase domain-containing protein
MIPPTAGFATADPELGFDSSPFYVNAALASWDNDGGARLAGVSAFGVGGTNAHVVLEEHAPVQVRQDPPTEQLVQVSARSAMALQAAVERLASHLEQADAADLGEVAHTLRVGRVDYPHRVSVVAVTPGAAAVALREAHKRHAAVASASPPRVVALFPGDMAFTDALRAWESLGIEPATMLGVGAGELVAATVAGVFDAATGARLAQLRERLLATAATGGLLGVSAPPDGFEVPGGLYLAAVNGPQASVVCGGDCELDSFAAQLAAQGITARRLPGGGPLPTPGIAEQFAEAVAQARPAAPVRPYLSTVTGLAVTPEQATDPHHWAGHLQATVLFGQCLRDALEQPAVVVDCGAGQLGRLAHQFLPKGAPRPIAMQPSPLLAAGQLWTHGVAVRLESKGRRVPLPGYPYERARHWIEPDLVVQTATQAPAVPQEGSEGLGAIWVQLLGVETVRADDDFFDLGGTSLLAAQLIARVREVFGVRLPMRSVFDTPTVREMAAKVAQLQEAAK